MKKVAIIILVLPLLTGCWDRLQLRNLHLVDIAGLDFNEESREVELKFIVTRLKSAGQGTGDPISEMTELKAPTLVEAVGQGEYIDQAPFLGISTRVYMISKRFASRDFVQEVAFLLHAPYSSINTPIVIFDGNLNEFLETKSESNKTFTKDLNEFILSLERRGIISNVSMMHFILSKEEPLDDLAIPIIKQSGSGVELDGALLFRQGTNTGSKLDKEQVRMMILLLGKEAGRQKFTGNISENSEEQIVSGDSNSKNIDYGFSIKKGSSKINVHPKSSELPKVNIKVRLKINVFELGKAVHKLRPDDMKRMEKELSKHFEEMAVATIETMQKANSDVLGIGKEIKAHHPNTWKNLNWRKDFPKMSIDLEFDVKILNSGVE